MTKRKKELYNAFAKKLDDRDKFMYELKKFYLAHGEVMEQHREQFEVFQKEGWKPWRAQKKVLAKIH